MGNNLHRHKSVIYFSKGIAASVIMYSIGIIMGLLLFNKSDIKLDPQSYKMIEIFINNFKVAMIIWISGLLTLGIASSLLLVVNGGVLGGAIAILVSNYGIFSVVRYILPHAILEIPVYIMFSSMSFELLRLIINRCLGKDFTIHIRHSIFCFIAGVVLLIIAAIIESSVSVIV